MPRKAKSADYEYTRFRSWVQCTHCNKWRKLPKNMKADAFKNIDWKCSMYPKKKFNCEAEEEKMNKGEYVPELDPNYTKIQQTEVTDRPQVISLAMPKTMNSQSEDLLLMRLKESEARCEIQKEIIARQQTELSKINRNYLELSDSVRDFFKSLFGPNFYLNEHEHSLAQIVTASAKICQQSK